MRAGALLLVAAACAPAATRSSAVTSGADTVAIRVDVDHLASDALAGRRTGTAGNDSAATYLARRLAAIGTRAPAGGYLQPFVARPAMHAGAGAALPTHNVVALVTGTDPSLATRYVVVGAHFDHLGQLTDGALDPQAGAAIRNGADDNASGTAAVLELARRFVHRPARRSLAFVLFSGEEQGLLGSAHFVASGLVPADRMSAMVNFDMVGRLRDDRLIVYGVATATEMPAVLDSANATVGLRIAAQGDGFGPSDHSSFYARDIPVLHFFTDLHDDYHRASDDAHLVNVAGIARVVDVAERAIRAIADRDRELTFVRTAAPVARGSRQGSDVYFGSIPDMAAGDVPGLRLTGVSPGGPADRAGLKAGDIIVEFGGRAVTDLNSYTDAMYAHKPGDEVVVVVLRNGQRLSRTVTLGRRGG